MRGNWGNAFRNDYVEPPAMTSEELDLCAAVTVKRTEGKKTWQTVTRAGQIIGYVTTRLGGQFYRLLTDENWDWRYVAGDWNRSDPPNGRAVLALLRHLEKRAKEEGKPMANKHEILVVLKNLVDECIDPACNPAALLRPSMAAVEQAQSVIAQECSPSNGEDLDMDTDDLFSRINGEKFKEQRLLLGKVRELCPLSGEELEALSGLENLLDSVADVAHDQYGIDCLLTEEADDDCGPR